MTAHRSQGRVRAAGPTPFVALALALTVTGCGVNLGGLWPWPQDGGVAIACTNDAQCVEGQVCFVDGCGDPGENLAVEVVPQQGSGEAQDFLLMPGELRAFQIFDLFPPSEFKGEISRSSLSGTEPYIGDVSISIRGESMLIPGVRRRYDAVSQTSSSTFSVQVGAGLYTLTARATDDVSIPPVVIRSIPVGPGDSVNVPIVFPGAIEVSTLEGIIVKTEALDPVQAALDIQVLDPDTGDPLSQRVPVAETGDFQVTAQYPRSSSSQVVLLVTPREPGALVPRRQFTVSLSHGIEGPLVFGDFGSAVSVNGRVVDVAGEPISGARVSLSGEVTNGGTFQTAAATTAVDGSFQLLTLAGSSDAPMTVTLLPPPTASAGLTVTHAVVPYSGGNIGVFTAHIRPVATALVLRPDGTTPAVGVRVVAEPVFAVEGEPLPSAIVEGKTDASGVVSFQLDPAVYRLDLSPGENLPRVTRYATVHRLLENGVPQTVLLPEIVLSSGRTVEGVVTVRQPGLTDQAVPAANATIRFFRITPAEPDKPGALLLAEGVADTSGHFKVVLPTR